MDPPFSTIHKGKRPLIIGHRGASALAPENTIAAFRKAIEDGADGIEFDVRLSKDGIPVVFHDNDLVRLAQIDSQVIDLSCEDLKKIDVGSWFNRKNPKLSGTNFTKERIPTLAELLQFLRDYDGVIYIELKCRKEEMPDLVKAVCAQIKDDKLFRQIILKCFKLRALTLAKLEIPEIYTASLFAPKILNVFRKKKHLLEKAEDCLANEISLHFSLATQKLVRRAQSFGFPTTIWTADNPRWVKRAYKLGINAVITNNPARLLAWRAALHETRKP